MTWRRPDVAPVLLYRRTGVRNMVGSTTTMRPGDSLASRPPLLIVEDDVAFAGTLTRMLTKDYAVEVVHRAEDALRRLRNGERFDAILCALQLPELSGLDLHAALLEPSPDQAAAMVFIVNQTPTREIRDFAVQMSARCVRRPFEISTLKAMIRAHLRATTTVPAI